MTWDNVNTCVCDEGEGLVLRMIDEQGNLSAPYPYEDDELTIDDPSFIVFGEINTGDSHVFDFIASTNVLDVKKVHTLKVNFKIQEKMLQKLVWKIWKDKEQES